MNTFKLKYFYIFGVFLLLLNFSDAKESVQAAGSYDALGDYYRLAMANF